MALMVIIQRRLPLTQGWPVCFGMPGRFGSEWVAVLRRNTHLWMSVIPDMEYGFPPAVQLLFSQDAPEQLLTLESLPNSNISCIQTSLPLIQGL